MTTTTTTTTWDVVVVGGGLAGLAAGAEVTATGGRALVVEGHRPGGRARVTERDGFTFNHGGHALYLGGQGMAVLRRHGIDPHGASPPLRRYRMSSAGRHHQFLSGPDTLLRTTILGARAKVQVGRLLAALPRTDAASLAGTSVSAWLGHLELRPDAEAVVRAIVRQTTYSSDLDDLDAGAAVTQLQSGVRRGGQSAAVLNGDMAATMALLADDVVLVSDGGRNRRAARHPIVGPERVSRFIANLVRRSSPATNYQPARFNGSPGLWLQGPTYGDTAICLDVTGDRVRRIWIVSAPDKLRAPTEVRLR